MQYDYDVVVIGGGAAGLIAASGAASLGARTAMIEKKKLGGDCTWYGCIPSKALLKSAQVYWLLGRLKGFGIVASDAKYDLSLVMPRVREIIKTISTHHPPEVFEKRGIKVLFGDVRFINNKTIELNGKRINSKRFIICTGSQPLIPPIEGLRDVDYLTNENIFDLEVLPKSLIVLGGGPIGIELSQAFSRLGSDVSVVEMLDRILYREDKEAAQILTEVLVKENVKIYTGKKAISCFRDKDLIAVTLEDANRRQSVIKAEKILVAVGRAANLAGLELEKAGVKYSKKGIETDETLMTSVKNIYAAGDVVGPYQFSHMAEYQAIIAVGNCLLPIKRKVNYNAVPWCTFTEPELAHVGLSEEEAQAKYADIKVYRSKYKENDRAVTDAEETGIAKVICNKQNRILGAHIVGANAGELIHEYVLAMATKLKINALSDAIHIYPTLSQVVKKTADQHYLRLMESALSKKLANFFIGIMR